MKPTTEQRSEIISEMPRVGQVLMSWYAYWGMEFPSRSALESTGKCWSSHFTLSCRRACIQCESSRARQAVFVFCLHLFTGRAQLICAQRNKGEGFCPSTFTLRFTRERESAMSPLLLRNMHKCRPQITYSREGVGEDLGEGERPFCEKPSPLIHWPIARCKEWVKRWR